MIQSIAKFNVRLTEKPTVRIKAEDGKEEIKDWGQFQVGKKYQVLSLYDSGTNPTELLLADDDGVLHWINMNICRRA